MFELIESARFGELDAQARARVGAEWPPIRDHFPGHPILPGSIQLELCAQLAGPLAERAVKAAHGLERWAFVVMVRNAAFEQPVALPATLDLRAKLTRTGPTNTTALVEVFVDEVRTCRAEIVMMMRDAEPAWADALADARARVTRWERA